MANQITDNRILLFDGDGVGGSPDDLVGGITGTIDTSTFLEGSSSYTASLSNSRAGMLYDAGSAQNWSNNTFSLTVSSGVVGLMDTKANGGFTVRFCGATVTNWFEVYVGGSDSWPSIAIKTFVNFVVDIELARSTAVANGWTNGTVPATSAIRYVGFSQILTSMPKMADNTWFDTVHRVADGTAGILIEGRNGGTTDWTSADIFTQLGAGQMIYIPSAGGSYVINTPIQFGINDTTIHGFSDTNVLWLWDNQEFTAADTYGISAVGNAGGTTNVTLGVKSGTLDDATGSQGFTISADPNQVRWSMDFSDPNLDAINFYGCSFQHGSDFLLNNINVSVISSLYIDCTSALVSNSEQLRNSIVNPDTADGIAFMTTDNLDDIIFCNFQFSDGHGVGLTTPLAAIQASKGNIFSGFGATSSTDAAIYNNSGGEVTINVDNGGSTPTYRNGTGASTTIVAGAVSLLVKAQDTDGAAIQNARILIESGATGAFPSDASVTITRASTTASVSHTAHGLSNGDKVIIRGANQKEYNGIKTISNVSTNAYDYTVTGSPTTPATGTTVSTFVLLDGLTDINGEITTTRTYSVNTPLSSRSKARKSTSAPYYKTGAIVGTINKDVGLNITVVMLSDE